LEKGNFESLEKGNFDSLEREILTVWKGKFRQFENGNFDSLEREIFIVKMRLSAQNPIPTKNQKPDSRGSSINEIKNSNQREQRNSSRN
jgi:hypothetical protein